MDVEAGVLCGTNRKPSAHASSPGRFRPTHVVAEHILQHRVKRAQHLVVPDEEVRLCAERVEHARELDGNVSGANDGDALGLLLDVEEAVRVDAVGRAGDLVIGRNGRPAADGNDNLLGLDRVRRAVSLFNLDLVLVDEGGVALVIVDLVVDQVLLAEGRGDQSGLCLWSNTLHTH